MRNGCSLNTKVYKKLTDSGLLLHYYSHVDGRYKRSLQNTMLNRVLKLSSTWKFFHEDCECLKETFATQTIFCSLPSANSSRQKCLKINVCKYLRIVVPFKDPKWANAVRKELGELSQKINVDIN